MIPQTIHQMFIHPQHGGVDGMGDDVRAQCAEWIRVHPHYSRRMWSLRDFLGLCVSLGRLDVAEAVQSCRLPAMQADIARLLILREYGGFWVDLKLHPLASFLDDMRRTPILFVEHFVKEGWHPGLPCSAFIGAQPRHPFFDTALALALEAVRGRAGHVFAVAGPAALERAIETHFGADMAGRGWMLPQGDTWGRLLAVGGGSYNGTDDSLHWSRRQGREPLYVS